MSEEPFSIRLYELVYLFSNSEQNVRDGENAATVL